MPDTDLITFLRARLDEDEHEALAASPGPWRANAEQDEVLAVDGETVADGFALSSEQLRATVRHIVRHDPARVLAEVEAKRRILDQHGSIDSPEGAACRRCSDMSTDGENVRWSQFVLTPCPTVRLLALPYADHHDYREGWKP